MQSIEKKSIFRRYVVFAVGLMCCSFGVALITRAALGTSPISSVAYVASLNTPISMGTYLLSINLLLILGQVLMLGSEGVRRSRVELLVQLPVSLAFGAMVDIGMALFAVFDASTYTAQIIQMLIGCGIMSLGISLEVVADVTMNSAEYFVRIASRRFSREFGTVKIAFDVTLVVIAILLSLVLSGSLQGVREGTVLVALLTGPFVRLFSPRLSWLRRWEMMGLPDDDAADAADVTAQTEHVVITVSRQYGSGGHELAEAIAQRLGIKFYDNQLIDMVVEQQGLTREYVSHNEQNMPTSLLLRMATRDYEAPVDKSLSPDDALFVAQSRVIRRLASQESCVIVGRCADYVLKDQPHVINIFVHAAEEYKVARATKEYGLDPAVAAREVSRINRARASHYQHYTDRRWEDVNNYDLVFDTSTTSTDLIVALVASVYSKA
jgi:uncharacterized membrane protein YczE/cytidylate kinase